MMKGRDSVYVKSVKLEFQSWIQMTTPKDGVFNHKIIYGVEYIIQGRFAIINVGKTPAVIDTMSSKCVTDYALIDTTSFMEHGHAGISANADIATASNLDTPIPVDDFVNGNKNVFMYGRIIYHDAVFKERRVVKFCYQLAPRFPGQRRDVKFIELPFFNSNK